MSGKTKQFNLDKSSPEFTGEETVWEIEELKTKIKVIRSTRSRFTLEVVSTDNTYAPISRVFDKGSPFIDY